MGKGLSHRLTGSRPFASSPNVAVSGSACGPPTTIRDQPQPKETMMRLCYSQHRFYAGIDLHATEPPTDQSARRQTPSLQLRQKTPLQPRSPHGQQTISRNCRFAYLDGIAVRRCSLAISRQNATAAPPLKHQYPNAANRVTSSSHETSRLAGSAQVQLPVCRQAT
jgi:hypothetical protein